MELPESAACVTYEYHGSRLGVHYRSEVEKGTAAAHRKLIDDLQQVSTIIDARVQDNKKIPCVSQYDFGRCVSWRRYCPEKGYRLPQSIFKKHPVCILELGQLMP